MKRFLTISLAVLMATTVLTISAYAWRSIRTGQKNFERAWSALHFKRAEKADAYFQKAADSFGQALAEQPPSRTTQFESNLTMAGISLYYAHRYDECIKAMDMVVKKDDGIWEGFLYKALSLAAKGKKGEFIKELQAYLDCNPGQYLISNTVKKQLSGLESGSASLSDAAAAIEDAALAQYQNNTTLNSSSNEKEQCGGRFWWRYNKAPCPEKVLYP